MKQVTKNWIALAQDDYDDSLYLFKGARHPNAVYHMCQAIEKVLKAALTELADEHPPKTHNLVNLAIQSGLAFSSEQMESLKQLRRHYDRVRYRDIAQASYNTKAKVSPVIDAGQTLYLWILTQLPQP
jgi:HEPN domain-containing protein